MEKKLFNLVLVLLISTQLTGQNDLQWLIFKGNGKKGTSTVSGQEANNYVYPFSSALEFNLDVITHPDRISKPWSKNDIFIIYSDNTFFNSRVVNNHDAGFFYNSTLDWKTHHFISSSASIQYLYLTNIYEGDDPPKLVNAKPGSGLPANDIFTIPLVSPAGPTPISASHDVVRNTDITLILNNAEIENAAAIAGVTVGTGFQYVLSYDTISPLDIHSADIQGNFFASQPIFTNSAGPDVCFYPPSCSALLGSNRIRVTSGCSPFTYVNLRPATILNTYSPGADGEPTHQAVFTVSSTTGQFITHVTEDIRSAHDPNFIRIDSICQDELLNYIVFSHLQFENASDVDPKKIKVIFDLPEVADKNCFEINDWFLGHSTARGKFSIKDRKVTCLFNTDLGNITKCNVPTDKTSCIGYINFKYKIGNLVEIISPEISIKVTSANVYFNTDRYPIRHFEDLLDNKYDGNGFVSYYRPLTIAHHVCTVNCKI